jgi:uncharacterized damage-inducible protein DinB
VIRTHAIAVVVGRASVLPRNEIQTEVRDVMDTATAAMLSTYNGWADDVLFAAMARLPREHLYQPTKTLFGSMIGTLNHNYQVDVIWRANILGEKHGFSNRREVLHPEFEDLVRAQTKMNRWFIDWARQQPPGNLRERVPFRFVSGKHAEMEKGSMLLHVINHKTYHRGWVSEMFFGVGATPPETDLSVFLTEQQTRLVA